MASRIGDRLALQLPLASKTVRNGSAASDPVAAAPNLRTLHGSADPGRRNRGPGQSAAIAMRGRRQHVKASTQLPRIAMSVPSPLASQRRLGRLPLFVSLLLAGALLEACGPSQPAPAAQAPQGGGAPPAMPVGVRSAELHEVPILIESVGQAEGSKEVEVRARVTGLIEKQLYREGERVRAGAPLFTIERAPFENAVAEARAALAQEQARTDQARREAARLKPLAEQQAISQREYDDAASTLRLAEAQIAVAQARLRDAQINLSYTTVNAPIAGLTGRAEKSEGSLVNPTDGLLTRMTQTDPIWVRFSFSESELAQLRGGKPGAVRLLDADGKPTGAPGKLNFAGSVVDPRLGTVQLRAEFPNPDLAILPGQFVRAQVQAGVEQAWLVPQAAVVSGDQGKMVWTIVDGKATPAPVQLGGWVGADWAVRQGLKNGDKVIVDNLLKLRPGAPVAVRPAQAAASGPAAAASAASAAR
jgi:membrane fusion protein (multidrug efflux system)